MSTSTQRTQPRLSRLITCLLAAALLFAATGLGPGLTTIASGVSPAGIHRPLPEPGIIAMIASGAGVLLLIQRGRRRR